ncbi:glycosyltransferase family 2 protein [Candidatus Pelagibacter bacterium]|nr:glycosyltransferase family 2 protein [Candidatus Pelagibacter bacterium]
MKKKILIFIITYHASFRLKNVFDLIQFKKFKDYRVKVLISEDQSGDDTLEVARSIYKKNRSIVFLKNNKKRLNYGGKIKSCLNYAMSNNFDYAIMVHGDGQYHPKYILPIIKKLEKSDCAAVCGSRMINKKNAIKGNMPFYKFVGNIFLTKLFNFVYATNFTDCHTGYWIYNFKYIKKNILKDLTSTFNFDNQMRINLVKNKLEINEIPIKTIYGNERSSIHLKYALKFFFETIVKKFIK